MTVMGAVLAGGASSRFGSDKALAMLGGRTLLDHARAVLAGVVDAVMVVGRGEIADLPRAGLGPLGGIAGALVEAERRGFASVVTIGCDMVRVPDGLLAALIEQAPSYCCDAPVLGHWPTTSTAALLDRLAPHALSSRACPGIHGAANYDSAALATPWTPGQARGDGVSGEGRRPPRDPSLSVRRWAIEIGAVAIPSPTPIANINTPADLPAS